MKRFVTFLLITAATITFTTTPVHAAPDVVILKVSHFMATSSKLSPKFPKVIMEENSKANGSAVVKVLTETRPINSKMVKRSSPFPTKSSMYNQKNCIVSTNIQMAKAAKNGAMNARRISMSNFLNNVKVLASYHQRDEIAL